MRLHNDLAGRRLHAHPPQVLYKVKLQEVVVTRDDALIEAILRGQGVLGRRVVEELTGSELTGSTDLSEIQQAFTTVYFFPTADDCSAANDAKGMCCGYSRHIGSNKEKGYLSATLPSFGECKDAAKALFPGASGEQMAANMDTVGQAANANARCVKVSGRIKFMEVPSSVPPVCRG